MELFIDNRRCDLPVGQKLTLDIKAADLADVASGREGRTYRLSLPATPRNRALFAGAGELHAREHYNRAAHTGRIECEGCVMWQGSLSLIACGEQEGGMRYEIELRGGGARWAEAAGRGMFNALPVSYSALFDAQTISESWQGSERPLRFLPVLRDRWPLRNSATSLQPPHTILSAQEYHPFLHVATLVEALFTGAGYRLESRFMRSDTFRSLYMSGRYAESDSERLRGRIDFCAGRRQETTAQADVSGRVYADPYALTHTVGNLFDTTDAADAPDLFDAGGSFRIEQGEACFKPPFEVEVGFEFRFSYLTDYRIRSRSELAGFDRMRCALEPEYRFVLANRFEDQRSAFRWGVAYRAVVFDHTPGNVYQLRFRVEGQQGERVASTFALRSVAVSTAVEGACDPSLYYRAAEQTDYLPWPGDWALYYGHVEETGRTEVEVTLRTPLERLSPSRPKYFRSFYFGGAEEGMELTLSSGVRLRPVVAPHPAPGDTVRFADVAAHPVRQAEFLQAVQHLFDLRFYTDTIARTVYAEPAASFHDPSKVVDWSGRIDRSRPVRVMEAGRDVHERITLCYAPGDGATARFNRTGEGPLGEWSADIPSRLALQGEQRLQNILFTPTLNATGAVADAPAASLMQAGDREAQQEGEKNFAAKIVSYCGLEALPAGQTWSYPPLAGAYPLAAFHRPQHFTLCFEDRDGAQGLHAYYDAWVRRAGSARRLEAWLDLRPADVAPLLSPDASGRDLRALFRLEVEGESGLYTLDEVCDFPLHGGEPTRCIFTQALV